MSNFNSTKEKKALLDNLTYLKSLDVREYTFQKKYDEIQSRIKTERQGIHAAQNGVWSPRDFDNAELTVAHINNLQPSVIFADEEPLQKIWGYYRLFVSSGEFFTTPGRFIKFFIVDTNRTATATPETIDRYFFMNRLPWPVLGIGAISSDLPSIGCRDKHIGWTSTQRNTGKSRNTAIGSTIVPTQPFGYNFNGGKLIAAMMTTEAIRNEWQLKYGDVLAGMTTTSLFGKKNNSDEKKSSIYDGLDWWTHIGYSKGLVKIQPKAAIYRKWLKHIKEEKAEEYDETMEQEEGVSGPVTNYKDKVLSMIYDSAQIDKENFIHGFERGVYFSEFYENTNAFLCDKINETELQLKPLFEGDVDKIMKWWRTDAIGRYKMLKKQGRIKTTKHFYNHLGRMDYATAKENFFAEVGR